MRRDGRHRLPRGAIRWRARVRAGHRAERVRERLLLLPLLLLLLPLLHMLLCRCCCCCCACVVRGCRGALRISATECTLLLVRDGACMHVLCSLRGE